MSMEPQLYIERPWEDSGYGYGLYPLADEELEPLLPEIIKAVGYEALIPHIVPLLEELGAAFRAEGYVKIDVARVTQIVAEVDMCFDPCLDEAECGGAWLDEIEAAIKRGLGI